MVFIKALTSLYCRGITPLGGSPTTPPSMVTADHDPLDLLAWNMMFAIQLYISHNVIGGQRIVLVWVVDDE